MSTSGQPVTGPRLMSGFGRPPGRRTGFGRFALSHPLTVAGVVAAVAGYLALVDPHQSGRYPGCPILFLTGHWCPGCGGLRALHDLLHGQVQAALSANLVVVLMVPMMVTLWIRWVFARSAEPRAQTRGRRLRRQWLLWSLLVVVLLFWGLRNLPAMAVLAP